MEPNPTPSDPQETSVNPSTPSTPPASSQPPIATPSKPVISAPDPDISQAMPRNDSPPSPTTSFTPSTPAATPAPTQPLPNVMVGDGGMAPPTPTPTPTPPAGTVTPAAVPFVSGGRKRPKKLLWAGIVVLLLLIAAAVGYFGYFMNPGVMYSQSLKNTGKGYDKLVNYVDQQEQLTKKGYTGSGSYKVKFGGLSTDGKIAFKGDSDNAELTFDVGLGVTRVNANVRTIKSSSDTPDVYVKAQDIKGLGTVLGIPDLDASLAKLDNTWIVIDHTLIDNLSGVATAQAQAKASALEGPTREQILDEARAFGKVNQDYVFSTSKDKAVTKIVKKYGKETVDGHKTYHYKIALQKDNVKKYIYAQRDALKASKLNNWIKQNKYDKDVYASFDDAAKSTKDIKSTDTYDIWVDTSQRVVYKVRFSEKKNPATNYVDVGLNYQGGDIFPFFVAGNFKEDDTTTFKFGATLNTKSGGAQFNLDVSSNSKEDGGNITAALNFKPSTGTVKVTKPTGAKPLSQVLSELGFGDILSQYTAAGVQANANDSERKADMATIQTQLEAFFQNAGYYPSLTDMNSSSWLATNMKSLDQGALVDPGSPSKSKQLAAAPAANVYAYQVTDSSGKSCEANQTKCAKYTLTATFESAVNGQKTYSKSDLD